MRSTASNTVANIHQSLEAAIKEGNLQKIQTISSHLGKVANTKAAICTVKSDASNQGSEAQTECIEESPAIMMIQYAQTSCGEKVGVLWDSASDTNYCTNEVAERLKLKGEPFTLVINGIAGIQTKVDTMRYLLKLKSKFGIVSIIVYGIDQIACITKSVDLGVLLNLFPDYSVKQLERPSSCDILLSQANASLMPSKGCAVGDLVMWYGPLSNVVSGAHKSLKEEGKMFSQESVTHLAFSLKASTGIRKISEDQSPVLEVSDFEMAADEIPRCYRCRWSLHSNTKELVQWFQYDQIGAACVPRCGSCRCGNCSPGGKQMTLKEERELKQIEECLTFKRTGDQHSPNSHWDAKYPYLVNPRYLPDNYKAVKGVLMSTLRRLKQDPEWKRIYSSQNDEMVARGAARKLTREELMNWKGPVWYIAHQIPNPSSKTTPCRLVWNSSQPVNGQSLNSILAKGPDVLNPIRCVLLRFREGLHAFVGDVSKMYNSVFLEDKEVYLHRFLWPRESTGEIETYAILRVNIGDRPAACLTMLATRLNAQLPEFSDMHKPVDTILRSMYVDDILDSVDCSTELETLKSDVEHILARGGFKIKMWLTSGIKPPDKAAVISLPNALKGNESTALGFGYNVEEDILYVRSSINFSRNIQKMQTGPDLKEDEIESNLPMVLSKRIVLRQLMGIFDPSGFISPFRMREAILFRKTWQRTLNEKGKFADWDFPISQDLCKEWLEFFKDATRVPDVEFPRSLKAAGCFCP